MQQPETNPQLEEQTPDKFEYWAAVQSSSKLAGHLQTRVEDYYRYTSASGMNAKWLRSYMTFYPNFVNNAQIVITGENGQFSVINVAEASNIIQHLINLTITDRPAWSPQATNSDVKSQRQVEFCKGLLDYYMREKRVDKSVYKAVEFAFVMGEGFVSVGWDDSLGTPYSFDPYTNAPVNTGDLRYQTHEPIDVIRDVKLNDFRDRDWLILREYHNRYTLMAKFPDFAQKIHGISCEVDYQDHYRYSTKFPYSTDQIPVYRFLHSKTAASPDGRLTLFLSDNTVLSDGQLPYTHIPVSRVTPRDVIGQSHGHAPMFDLIPVNDNLNMLYSTILTNQEAFGVPNIAVQAGSNIDIDQLTGGFNLVNYTGDNKPEAIQLLNTPPEIFNAVNMLTTATERISGVNTVTRGNAPTNDSSGALAALLQQMSIDFSQPAQWSYIQLLEDIGTTTVQILQKFANKPRIVTIAGKRNRADIKEFTSTDIEGIDRVLVDVANPMSKSATGRLQLAQLLIQAGVIKMPDEILQVLDEGILDPMTQGKTSELLGLAAENESLSNGKQVPVIFTDDHLLHINEHKSLLSDPDARNDPKTIQIVTAHMLQHIQMLQDPDYAIFFKLVNQPVVPPQGGAPGMPPQAAPGGPPSPQAAQQVVGQPQNAAAMVQHMQPNQPQMPVNPLSHQRAPGGA